MPVYTYKCPSCNDEFEERRKISEMDDPFGCLNPDCPSLEAKDLSLLTATIKSNHKTYPAMPCKRIMSLTAPGKIGGQDGKAREHKLIKDRNATFWDSKEGKDEQRANKERVAKKYNAF